VWSLVCRQWQLLLLALVLGIGLAAVYCLCAPAIFESRTSILLARRDAALATQGTESNPSAEPGLGESLLATHIQILLSPEVVQKGLDSRGLDKLPSLLGALGEDQTPLEYTIENLQVTRGGEGQGRAADVLNVRFRHRSAADCQTVLKAVVDSYQRFLGERSQRPIEEALRLVQQTSDQFQRQLRQAEQQYQEFRQNAPVLWKGDESFNAHRSRVEGLEAQLTETQLELINTRSRWETVTGTDSLQGGRPLTELEKLAAIGHEHIPRMSLFIGGSAGRDQRRTDASAGDAVRTAAGASGETAAAAGPSGDKSSRCCADPRGDPSHRAVSAPASATRGRSADSRRRLGRLSCAAGQ
jgi:hypothetical protein